MLSGLMMRWFGWRLGWGKFEVKMWLLNLLDDIFNKQSLSQKMEKTLRRLIHLLGASKESIWTPDTAEEIINILNKNLQSVQKTGSHLSTPHLLNDLFYLRELCMKFQ